MMRYSVSEGRRFQWNTDIEVNRSTMSKLKILKKKIYQITKYEVKIKRETRVYDN